MKKFWSDLLQTGIGADLSPAEIRKIRLLNGISFASSMVIAIYLPISLALEILPAIVTNALGCILCLVPIYLNQVYRHQTARIFFCIAISFYFTISAVMFGREIGTENIIFASSILPLIFFRRYSVVVALLTMSVVFFALSKASFYYVIPIYTHSTFEYFYYLNTFFTFVLLFVTVSTFKSEHEAYQKVIEQKNEAITHSLRYAQRIQRAILGSQQSITRNFREAFIFFSPKDIVSGDFFWFAQRDKHKIVIAADCTGHGVPGAFMTVMGNALLNEIVNEREITMPDQILYELDKKVVATLQRQNGVDSSSEVSTNNDGMDMAVLVFEESGNGSTRLLFAGAKNPLCYVRRGELHQIKGSKFPVGSTQYKQKKVFELHQLEVEKGDCFYIFSDGFQDQFGGKEEKKYMVRQFKNLLLRHSNRPMHQQEEQLRREFHDWKGKHEQTDDVLVMGIRY